MTLGRPSHQKTHDITPHTHTGNAFDTQRTHSHIHTHTASERERTHTHPHTHTH
jgi:hypothetical protein